MEEARARTTAATLRSRQAAGVYDPEKSKNVTIHTLRHTFESWLALKGVPLRRIQYLMGHNSITTTERYAHLVKEEAYEDTRVPENMAGPFLLGSLLGRIDEEPVSCSMRKGGLEPPRREPLDPKSYRILNDL